MKKYVFLFLLTLLPMMASADSSGTCGDNLTWTYESATYTLTISGNGGMSNYTRVEDVPWYSFRYSIRTVVIQNGVTSIGAYAFDLCSGLTSVTIPNSVTSINNQAFYGCSGLTSVTIPDGVTSIGSSAFENCSLLTSVTIPDGVTSIGSSAFSGTPFYNNMADGVIYLGKYLYGYKGTMPENTEIVIADGTTLIGNSAFYGCSGLTSVTIPNSVTSIGSGAFSGCSGLTSVTIPNSVTSIGGSAFNNCRGLTSVTIPNSVTSIGNSAFYNCSGLTSVTIGNSVTSIGEYAFYNCSGLTSVTIGNSVTSIGNYAFENCSGLTSVHISDLAAWCNISFNSNPLNYAHHLYLNGTEVTDLVIPNSVTSIRAYAFRGCSGLTSVTIPNSVTSIGDQAFYGCSGLPSVTIPNSVTSIGEGAFSGCNIVLAVLCPTPPTINNIGYSNKIVMVPSGCEEAYANAEGWKNYNIIPYEDPTVIRFKDQNVKDICVEHWDLNGDGELDTWEAMRVQDIGTTFRNNTNIMKFDEFKYFKSVTNIPSEAFMGCTNLRAITIPENVNTISGLYWWQEYHYGPFKDCSSLTSINIPSSITLIDWEAFSGCTKLNAVHITDLTAWCNISFHESSTANPLFYAHHLFLNDEEVTELVIPDGITSINADAFEGASSLTSVIIPEGVTTIGHRAFRGCSGITAVTIPASVTSFGENVFENSGLTAVDITDLGAWLGFTFENANCNPLNQVHHLRLNGEEVTDLTIPEGVTEIGNYAFYGGTGFTSVNIPGTVTNIGSLAFYGCSNISTVAFSEGIQNIGAEAFRNCSGLTTVSLPEGVTTVGDNAFNTGSLINVTLPSTLYSFGNTAFGNGLRSVAVTTDEPPLIGENAFPNRTNALLVVPQGSTAAYQEEMYWQDFKAILEYPGGDVNADGDTNMVDVVDIVRFVVGTPSDMFIEVMADLNNSKSVNVADAVVLVNEIVGDMNYAKPMWAPAMTDDVLALAGDGNRLSLLMEGNGQYAAFQCDLWLPEGMDVMDVQLNDSRRQGHQLLYNKVGDGHYRVVAISTAANSFRGTGGELLGLTLDGFATDDIRMDNIHFVTTRGDDIAFDDLDLNYGNEGVATGIASTAKEKESGTIYNLNGQRLIVPQKGLNIVNGKKVVVK